MLPAIPLQGLRMNRTPHAGGCHCGNLRWHFDTAQALGEFAPRACDCDFCSRHHAAWVSDPQGALRIHARDAKTLRRYRQGSGQAECLVCGACGVLVAILARSEDGRLLAAVNRNAFDDRGHLAPETVVSPHTLAPDARLARWTQLWTPTELVANR